MFIGAYGKGEKEIRWFIRKLDYGEITGAPSLNRIQKSISVALVRVDLPQMPFLEPSNL